MGYVVDIRSASFLLLARKRPAVLSALQALARERPAEFDDPDAVIAASDLLPALEANYWRATLDAEGNVTTLEFRADKLPRDSSATAPEAFLAALSRHVAHGVVLFTSEGDPGHETRFTLGKKLQSRRSHRERYVFEPLDECPRIEPGQEARRTIRLVHQWGDEVVIHPAIRHPDLDVLGHIDTSPMTAGQTREITLRAGPDALGPAWTILDAGVPDRPEQFGCNLITVEIEPHEQVPLDLAVVEPEQFQGSRKFLLSAKEIPRALADLKAHAAREKSTPGGAFLEDIEHATDLGSAFAAAGIVPKMEGAVVRSILLRTGVQPGSESHLRRLLRSFAERTLASSGGGFRFVKRDRPSTWVAYGFSACLRRSVHPRALEP